MPEISKAQIDTLMSTINTLERRVSDLERATGLVGAIPQGQRIEVLDPADGSKLVTLGLADDGLLGAEFRNAAGVKVAKIGELIGGQSGVAVGNNLTGSTADTWLQVNAAGISVPFQVHPWYKSNDAVTINTAGYTTGYFSLINILTGKAIGCQGVTAVCDVGTTGDFRLTINGFGSTSAVAVGSGATVQQNFAWDTSLLGVVVGSGPLQLKFEARRLTGAGNIYVYAPSEVYISTDLVGMSTAGF